MRTRARWVRCGSLVVVAAFGVASACGPGADAAQPGAAPPAAAQVPAAALLPAPVPAPAPAPSVDDAKLAYVEGLEHLQAGRFDDAIAAFSRAVDLGGESVDYRVARGAAQLFAEKPEAAVKDLDRAMQLSERSREARLWRAAADRMQANFFTETYPQATNDPFESRVGDVFASWGQTFRKVEQGYEPGPEKEAAARAALADLRRWFTDRKLETGGAAEVRWARGRARCDRGEWAQAAPDVEAALAAWPDDLTVLRYHAAVRLALGDATSARREFTRVLTEDTTVASAYAGRALAAARTGDARRADADLAEADALQPGLARTNRAAVDAALADARKAGAPSERRRYDETYQEGLRERERRVSAKSAGADDLADLAAWIYEHVDVPRERVEPRGEPRMFRHQTAASQTRELARTEDLCDRAIAKDAGCVKALVVKAAVRMWNMRYGDAETLLKRALDEAPTDAQVLRLLSRVMDVAAAQKRAFAASLRSPTVVGSSTRTEGDYEVTTTWWRQPSQAELAEAARLEAEADVCLKRAQDALETAARANAGNAQGAYLRGVIEVRLGHLDGARAAFADATVKDPAMVDAWFQLAWICSQLGRGDDALAAQAAGFDLIETTAAPHLSAAWRAIERTQFRTAAKLLDEAARHDPEDARVPAYRGVALEGDEKPGDASAQYGRALDMERARARLGGTSFDRDDTRPVATPLLGLFLALQRRLAAIASARGDDKAALAILGDVLAIEPRLVRGQGTDDLPAAMLPAPGQEPGVIPESFPVLAHVAWARVRSGEALFRLNDLAGARAMVGPVFAYGPSMINGKGADRFREQELWARVLVCRITLAEGKLEEARRMAMGLPRMRHGVGPSKGAYPELERVGQELGDEIERRWKEAQEKGDERWDPQGAPDPEKARAISRRILDDSGLTDFALGDARAANVAAPFTSILQQAALVIVTPKSNQWRDSVRVMVQQVQAERDRTAESAGRSDQPADPRFARRDDGDLYRRLLEREDKALELLRTACVAQGYPADALEKDLAAKSGAPGAAPFTGDPGSPEARIAALCERVGVPYLRKTDRFSATPESMAAWTLRQGAEAIAGPKTAQWRQDVVASMAPFAQQKRQGDAQLAEIDRRLADLRQRAGGQGRNARGLQRQIDQLTEQRKSVESAAGLASRGLDALRDEAVQAGYPRDALDADLKAAGLTR